MNARALSVRFFDSHPSPALHGRRRRRLRPSAQLALGVLVLLVVVAVAAPLIAPFDPLVGDRSNRLLPPLSGGHLLGTDGLGRDILSRVIWGARPSLLAGLIPVGIGVTFGMMLGIFAGLGGRRSNAIVMRSLDVFYAFPAILLAIAIAAALGAGLTSVIIALSLVNIPPVARVVETEVLRLRDSAFMESARLVGAGWFSIALRQVIPNVAPAVIVYGTGLFGMSIVYAAGLGFLGLGMAPPTPEWGIMVNELRQFVFSSPAIVVAPALVLVLVSFACNVLGDGLGELFDLDRAGLKR